MRSTLGDVSPPIDVTLLLVGQEHTMARLDHVIGLIEARAPKLDETMIPIPRHGKSTNQLPTNVLVGASRCSLADLGAWQ